MTSVAPTAIAVAPAVTVAGTIHETKMSLAELCGLTFGPAGDNRRSPHEQGEQRSHGDDDPVVEHGGFSPLATLCHENGAVFGHCPTTKKVTHV